MKINTSVIYEIQGSLTESEFSDKLQISRSQLWRIKNNKSNVGIDFLFAVKKAFPNVDLNIFFVNNVTQNTQSNKKVANE